MPFDYWKSCRRDKRLVGSNPTLSAIYSVTTRGFAISGEAPCVLPAAFYLYFDFGGQAKSRAESATLTIIIIRNIMKTTFLA